MQLQAAKEWGITPDEFLKKSRRTQAEMMATIEVQNLIDAYYSEAMHAEIKKNADHKPK